MNINIIPERLAQLPSVVLTFGSHKKFSSAGACAMEVVSWLAGETHSDHPQCACPIIAGLVRHLNDWMRSVADRQRVLLPIIPKLVGSRGFRALTCRRAYAVADWAVRDVLPAICDRHGWTQPAKRLRSLPEIVDVATSNRASNAAFEVRTTTRYASADASYLAGHAAYTACSAFSANCSAFAVASTAHHAGSLYDEAYGSASTPVQLIERLLALTE
jgi:hypothetical protein